MKRWFWLIGATALLGQALATPLPVQGASSPSSVAEAGVSIEPFLQDLTLKPDQPSLQTSVKFTNSTNFAKNISVTPIDLRGLDETGGLILIGQDIPQLQRKYGLVNWLTLPQSRLTVPAKTSVQIPFIINNRTDLSPGGHYAVLIFREEGGPKDKVQLHQAITEILLVRKLGGEKYGLALNQHSQRASWWTLPRTTTLNLRNTGNVHAVPRGVITLKAPGGKLIRRGIINAESAFILPDQARKFPVELASVGSAWWPGIYNLRIDYRYDGSSKFQTTTKAIYHLGAVGLFIVLFLALILLATIVYMYRRKKS